MLRYLLLVPSCAVTVAIASALAAAQDVSSLRAAPDGGERAEKTAVSAPPGTGDAPRLTTQPLFLRDGGTPEQPAVFDGRGLVIDLGIDVTDHDWIREGDVWRSRGRLLDRDPIIAGQSAGLFLDELPLVVPRDVAAEKLHPDRKSRCYFPPAELKPGQMGYAEDGAVYFRWPPGKAPEQTRIIMPPLPGVNCVTIACSHIIVRDVTARHAANDGFNIHGKWTGIRLENVRAFSNGDEGISAHDDVEMSVHGAEIAWNGSVSGGVTDVNRCTTSYDRCVAHDNVGPAFNFAGAAHALTNSVIYRQDRDCVIAAGTLVRRENNDWRK